MIISYSSPGQGLVLASRRPLLLLITVFSIFWLSAHATCYFPNGTDRNAGRNGEPFQPCNPGDEHSMCCGLNLNVKEQCRSDGLCFAPSDSNVWRDACTDPTWKSPSCIRLCVFGMGMYNSPETLTDTNVRFKGNTSQGPNSISLRTTRQ